MTKFTIAIPIFKIKFFKECLDSILNQTYTDFEVQLLNDASPDDFDSLLQEYHDPRIHYHKNAKNSGALHIIDNWNKLLNWAQGEFIILMGDDDRLSPRYLETFNQLIEKYPDVDCFHSRVMLIDEESKPFELAPERCEYESPSTFLLQRMRKGEQYIGDFCIRRQKIIDVGGYPSYPWGWCTDDIISFEAAVPHGVVHTKEPLFFYRASRYSISSSSHNAAKLEGCLGEHHWFDHFAETYQPKDEEEQLLFEGVKKDYFVFEARKEALYLSGWLQERWTNIFRLRKLVKKLGLSKYAAFYGIELCANDWMKKRIHAQ